MKPIKVPANIDRIEPYVPGKPMEEVERELGLKNTIKLASNENPLGPSPRAVKAVGEAVAGIHRYPDGSGYYLKERLSRGFDLPFEQVLLGNGSTELVEILARTFLGADGSAVMADQAFIMYRIAVMAVNGNARLVPLRKMRHDLPSMADRVDASTRLVFIANPNNPTGTCVTHQEMVMFLDRVPEETLVVVDEAYLEYVADPDYPDTLSLLKEGRRLAVLRTFSKAYGLAGLRLGYALTTADVVRAAEKVRSPFNTSSLAQAAGIAALDDLEHIARSREQNALERDFLQTELARRGILFTPSVANFVLVDTRRDADRIFASMLRSGVIIRPMRAYNLPTCIRVSIGIHEENLLFLSALERALAGEGPPARGDMD